MGTFNSTYSYFYDRLKRKYTVNELQTRLKQIDIIRNFDKHFAEKLDQIVLPIKTKYL